MSNAAVEIEQLGKRYRIGTAAQRHDSLREALAHGVKAPFRNLKRLRRLSSFTPGDETDVVWALRDVSFSVRHGEVVGIIGRNGAGKSTLLKVLSRITEPTTGRARVNGRAGALLEVGTGFHPELTGRENVYLNGSILGMDRRYIDRRFEEIIEFSGVERFIDTPVKRYSSGMYLRLAFAVAAHLEPDILIVDEVLAVGDLAFQKKCIGKMGEVAKAGRTVFFVSHNLSAIESLCHSGVLLDAGQVAARGSIESVLAEYRKRSGEFDDGPIAERTDRRGSGAARLTDFRILNGEGEQVRQVLAGDRISFRLAYERFSDYESTLSFLISVNDGNNQRILGLDSETSIGSARSWPRSGELTCEVATPLSLAPGDYSVAVALLSGGKIADHLKTALQFQVVMSEAFNGGRLSTRLPAAMLVQQDWKLTS